MMYFMIFGQEMFWDGEPTREGEGRGICSRLTEGQPATCRFFIPISPRFEYYMNLVENFRYLKRKKCKLSSEEGLSKEGRL